LNDRRETVIDAALFRGQQKGLIESLGGFRGVILA
jgi:hypothetical protein